MEDKIKVKIRKLLRMGKDKSSPNEAARAMSMARKLLDKYQLTQEEVESGGIKNGEFFEVTVENINYRRVPLWFASIFGTVGRYNNTLPVILSDIFGNKSFVFRGREDDCDLAINMLDFLLDAIKGKNKSFRIGFSQGLKDNINLVRKNALVLSEEQLIEKFGKGRVRKGSIRGSSDVEDWMKGNRAGKLTNLSPAIGSQ